ncbi:MAG: hypothetical protein CM15mP31_4150 [Gammaproteobacteria bacterium]|nr:MAG: hypothetical protein CM15mP31_4150 [Gammaproteobacteria bacterium]
MSGTVGMISQATSGKAPAEKMLFKRNGNGRFFANNMTGPEAIEMPENISETGMMMGANCYK